MQQEMGPRLSDEAFFVNAIDANMPGMEGMEAAAAAGDFALCRRLFAGHVRESLRQREDTFLSIPYEFPENNFILPGERVDEAISRIRTLKLAAVSIPYQFEGKVDWFSNHAPDNYREWNFQLNRHPEFKLLAHHYRETGEESDAEAFAGLFDSWVKQALVPKTEDTEPIPPCWRTIECGIRMGANWPYSLFAFYKSPAFTDDLLIDWYKSVWEHGEYLRRKHRDRGNWLIMEMNGLGQIGILYPQFKKSGEWLDYAMKALTEELDRQVYPDGFQYELSTGYHYVVINNYMRFIKTAEAFGVKIPTQLIGKLEHMLEVYVQLMMPDGCTPDLNDGGHKSVKALLKSVLPYFPENKYFQWVCKDHAEEPETGHSSEEQKNLCNQREKVSDGVGRNDVREPEYQSIALEYAGMMIMRDGWNADSTWALLDAGPFGTGHQHEDKLNFLIYAGGKEILTECGNYAYDGSKMRQYALSTRSHNTVRVDGMDQNRRGSYQWHAEDICRKADMQYSVQSDMDWVSGVYTEGYGQKQDCNVAHRRTVMFIKKPESALEPFFVVIDRMYAEEEHSYEVLWHMNAEHVTVEGKKVQADFLHIFLNGTRTTLISGQKEPEWQGWTKGKTFVQGDIVPQPVLRYDVKGSNERIVTVFYPHQSCPIDHMEAKDDIWDKAVTLVMQDGSRVEIQEPDVEKNIAK